MRPLTWRFERLVKGRLTSLIWHSEAFCAEDRRFYSAAAGLMLQQLWNVSDIGGDPSP